MKLKTSIITLFIVTILVYITGFTGDPFLFIIFLPIGLFALFMLTLLSCLSVIWMRLSDEMKSRLSKHKTRIFFTVLICLIFFLISGWTINFYYLPDKLSPVSLAGDLGILIFTISLGMNLIKPNRKRILVASATGVFLFLFIFTATHVENSSPPITPASNIETLKTLPYLSYVVEDKNTEKEGVQIYKQDLCNEGINIYNSYAQPGAYLLDMSGNILQTWLPPKTNAHWHYVKMDTDGDLLVIIKDHMLMRLGWNSEIKWVKRMRFHHDLAINSNREIYALSRKDELLTKLVFPLPVLNDFLIVLSPEGKIKKEISLYKVLEDKISFGKLVRLYTWLINPKNLIKIVQRKTKNRFLLTHDTPADIFHANTIEIINKDINHIFKKGNILFCSKTLNLIGVIDVKMEKLIWSWGTKSLELPHHPTLLENGNILIFDNGTISRKYSRIIEIDPLSGKIVWEYKEQPPEAFYSLWGGSNQKLPNGNILITDSVKGRVFEIRQNGEIVWEFYNPNKNKFGKRATIYRMMRIPDPENYHFPTQINDSKS